MEVFKFFYFLLIYGKVMDKILLWFYIKSDYYQDFGIMNVISNFFWIVFVNLEFFIEIVLWNISWSVIEILFGGKMYFLYDVVVLMY